MGRRYRGVATEVGLSPGVPRDPETKRANARLYARRQAIGAAHESARDLETSARRLLSDLRARGADAVTLARFRAALAAHTDVTRRKRTISEMLAALEALERHR
jgi:hypothetical protein